MIPERPFGFPNRRIITATIQVLALFLAIIPVLTVNWFFYPQVFLKTISLYLIAGILFILYVCLIISNPSYFTNFFQRALEKKSFNLILLSVTVYVVLVTITNFFAENPYLSFFGSPNFAMGVVSLLCCYVCFVVLATIPKDKWFWDIFILLNVLVGIVLGIYAICEKFILGLPLIHATFSNPSRLAGYMVFIFFFSLILFNKEENFFKLLSILGLVISAFTVVISNIRGAILGLVVGLLFAGLVQLSKRYFSFNKKFIIFFWAGFLFLALGGFILLVSGKSIKNIENFFGRSVTIKTRIIAWDIAIKGIKDRPISGYGSEAFYVPFEKYFNPAYYEQYQDRPPTEHSFSLPHNKPLEVAVSSGIFALFSYLLIFLASFFLLIRKYWRLNDRISLLVGALLVSYFVHLFFLFDDVVSLLLFYSVLAFSTDIIYFAGREQQNNSVSATKNLPRFTAKHSYFVIAASVAAVAFFYWQFVFRLISANRAVAKTIAFCATDRYDQAKAALDELKKSNVFYLQEKGAFEIIQLLVVKSHSNNKISDQERIFSKDLVEFEVQNINKNPKRLYPYVNLARLINDTLADEPAYLELSRDLSVQALRRGSKRYETLFLLAEVYLHQGKNKEAKDMCLESIELHPNFGLIEYHCADILMKAGDFEAAKTHLDAAIEKGYANMQVYKKQVDLGTILGDYNYAAQSYERVIHQYEQKDLTFYSSLLNAYLQANENEKAKVLVEEIKRKFPEKLNQIYFLEKRLSVN